MISIRAISEVGEMAQQLKAVASSTEDHDFAPNVLMVVQNCL